MPCLPNWDSFPEKMRSQAKGTKMKQRMDFLIGGAAAATAGFITNPLEVVKIRMQLQGELKSRKATVRIYQNSLHAAYTIARYDGLLALQSGLIPALFAQMAMNGTKLGLYDTATKYGLLQDERGKTIFYKGFIAAFVGGVCGGVLATPFFKVKTRLQSSAVDMIAVGHQHRHKGMLDAFSSMIRKEGILSLWKGLDAVLPRSGLGGAVQITAFQLTKEKLKKTQYFAEFPMANTFVASIGASFFTTVVRQPFDVISTRIFNQKVGPDGKGVLYTNSIDCCRKIVRTEGILGLLKGFGPNLMRVLPYSVLVLIFWDFYKQLYDEYSPKRKEGKKKHKS